MHSTERLHELNLVGSIGVHSRVGSCDGLYRHKMLHELHNFARALSVKAYGEDVPNLISCAPRTLEVSNLLLISQH